ncbi:MAG: hypothetical protein AAF791_08890 [Bacteroidota bacterium]
MARVLLACLASLLIGCTAETDRPGETPEAIPDAMPDAAAPLANADSAAEPDEDPLFGRDFAPVCRGSTGQPAAAEYVAGSGLHPFVLMASDDGVEFRSIVVGTFPDGWRVKYPDLRDAQLVVCAVRTEATPAQLCEGYDNDDGAEWSVQTHDTVYEYTVRNAQKGSVLATTTFEAPATRCPSFSTYREGDPNPKPSYGRPRDAEIELFVRSFVTGRTEEARSG